MAKSLDSVAAERDKFHLREMPIERQKEVATRRARRETGSILNEPHEVYGRDEEKEKIVDILVDHVKDSQQLSILPIIGLGGLGKTTLAQLVYNDLRVTKHFDTKLWVCVSDDFDLNSLVKMMIESATGSGSASDLKHLDALQRRLWELLNLKRYLLILDDVWNEDQEKWAMLKNVLACGSRGTSIIVTTRLKKVADIMGTLRMHHLNGLSEDHCWLLFKQRAFGQDRSQVEKHLNLETIGRQIVKKCAGVPLAAKALGGLLRFKRQEKEWIYVKDSEIWNLPQEETSILPALRLSYRHLPLMLRRCFAFCAIFPKDYKIIKQELIFCWMAHGCISSNGGLEAEDIGDEVCNELVLRSLFHEVKEGTSFKMHDLIHDLALSVMENKVPGTHLESYSTSASNSEIHQVNLHEHRVAFPISIQHEMDISSIFRKFSRLRMLDASESKIKDLPSAIGKLKHLRYLNLCHNPIRSLPNTICGLWNLQILDLSDCGEVEHLPKHMRYLNNLRHLFLENCRSFSQMPPKIGELTSLKTLSLFIVGKEKGHRLGELQNLNLGGELEIRHLERVEKHMDAKKANLDKKLNLSHLILRWEHDNSSESQKMKDEEVAEALEPHPNLERLSIFGFLGRCIPLWMRDSRLENITEIFLSTCRYCSRLPSALGHLPRLKSLKLRYLDALEYILEDESDGGNSVKAESLFQSLVSMKLEYLPKLKGLLKLKEEHKGEINIFPNLQKLLIQQCPLLMLPALLSSPKDLSVSNVSRSTLSLSPNLHNLTRLYLNLGIADTNGKRICIPNETLENLTNLRKLEISHADEHCLPVEGLRGLKSLTELKIECSGTMRCLPEGWLRYLTALEKLWIDDCRELVELGEGIKYLHSLKILKLYDLPKMVHLPEALQHLHSLEQLYLIDLIGLASLPDWLPSLISLEHLSVIGCTMVASLPSTIKGMTNLRSLKIGYCTQLMKRIQKGKGEDWHIIAHIPHLRIG